MEQTRLAAVYCLIRRVGRRTYACTLEIRSGFEAIIFEFSKLESEPLQGSKLLKLEVLILFCKWTKFLHKSLLTMIKEKCNNIKIFEAPCERFFIHFSYLAFESFESRKYFNASNSRNSRVSWASKISTLRETHPYSKSFLGKPALLISGARRKVPRG